MTNRLQVDVQELHAGYDLGRWRRRPAWLLRAGRPLDPAVQGRFGPMLAYAEGRKLANSNRRRPPYSILTNSCIHFVKAVAQAAGVDTPWMMDPRPNSYIGEFRSDFPDLDYDPKTAHLSIEGLGQY